MVKNVSGLNFPSQAVTAAVQAALCEIKDRSKTSVCADPANASAQLSFASISGCVAAYLFCKFIRAHPLPTVFTDRRRASSTRAVSTHVVGTTAAVAVKWSSEQPTFKTLVTTEVSIQSVLPLNGS